MSKVLFGADLTAQIARCTAELTQAYEPTTDHEVSKIKEMGRAKAQIDHGRNLKVIDLQRIMDRAILCWDSDRCIYIDDLTKRLPRDPARVARALGRSKQGVDWMISEWTDLEEALDVAGLWTDEQRAISLDLLGIRIEMRATTQKVPAATEAEALKTLVQNQLKRLNDELDRGLLAMDSATQAYAAAGGPLEEDQYSKNLRKYEACATRDYYRSRAELLAGREKQASGDAAPAAPFGRPGRTALGQGSVVSPASKAEPEIPGRPIGSKAAARFVEEATEQFQVDPALSGVANAKPMSLKVPFAVVEDESEVEPETDEVPAEPETVILADPVTLAEPVAVVPQPAAVARSASKSVRESDRRERERRQARAQEKQARKAARRRRR